MYEFQNSNRDEDIYYLPLVTRTSYMRKRRLHLKVYPETGRVRLTGNLNASEMLGAEIMRNATRE